MQEKIPRCVPLTNISEFTDEIVFGGLALPVGFDESKLHININAIQRVQKIAGLGAISIRAIEGSVERAAFEATGITRDGALTGGRLAVRDKGSLSAVKLKFPIGSSFFDKPTVVISANRSEMNERIFENKKDHAKSVNDPSVHAKYLNLAVREGLVKASMLANYDTDKLTMTLKYYGFFGSLAAFGHNRTTAIPLVFGLAPVFYNVGMLQKIIFDSLKHSDVNEKIDVEEIWKRLRQTTIFGIAIDRAGAGALAAKSVRIIKASE